LEKESGLYQVYQLKDGTPKKSEVSVEVSEKDVKIFKNQILIKSHLKMSDFENHLDDVSLNWLENQEIVI
jgi:hypothetical protein